MPLNEEMHKRIHDELRLWVGNRIVDHRDEIGLDASWVLESGICCAPELPTQEAVANWDAEVHYARLRFRCDLPQPLLLWLIVHELYEVLLWETADLYMETSIRSRLNRHFGRYLQDRYRAARNRQIELLVFRHLGYRRPAHMMQSPLPEIMPYYEEQEKGA